MLPSNCSNGLNGLEDTNGIVCCSDMCDFCGGSGCGSFTGTTANDCCIQEILSSGQYCGDDVVAPCILVDDMNTAAPTMTTLPSTSPTTIDGGLKCLEDRRTHYTVMLQSFINLNLLQLTLEFLGDYYRRSSQLPAYFPPRTFSVKGQVCFHPTAPTVLTG